MVDIDFIIQFMENNDSHLIERGDTIPIELSEYLADKNFTRFSALLKSHKRGNHSDERYKVELRCGDCGSIFVKEYLRTTINPACLLTG